LLAQVVLSEYADHFPLYRQEQIFKQRHRVELSRQTLAGWIDLVADWLQPIYGALAKGSFRPALRADRRNTDPLSFFGQPQNQTGLLLDRQPTRLRSDVPLGDQPWS
jgi:hypothetical protein